MKPQLWIVGGANGSGKSTLADRYLADRVPVLNPDNIARQRPGITPIEAGKVAIRMQKQYLGSGQNFAWETTLSGHREIPFMQEAKGAGYKVNLVYLGVLDSSLSILRVAERVESGGHNVPRQDIERRFDRSLENLSGAIAAADRAWIFDNSSDQRRLLLSVENDLVKHCSRDLPDWLAKFLPSVFP